MANANVAIASKSFLKFMVGFFCVVLKVGGI